jgi:hypothetical protein
MQLPNSLLHRADHHMTQASPGQIGSGSQQHLLNPLVILQPRNTKWQDSQLLLN